MTEDHDSKITDLYRQSSQETPPAHVDRAVMGMARKSVRSKVHAPFGSNWVAGGAMVGVVLLSILLILDMPQQPDRYTPVQDAVAPSDDAQSKVRKEAARRRALPSESASEIEEKRESPASPEPRFNIYEVLPDMEVVIPEVESQGGMKQSLDSVKEKPASTAAKAPVATWYLQAGSFRDKSRAVELQAKLTALGFKCEIQEVTVNNTDVYHRVRVGPFTDLEMLDQSRQKLDEMGIETRKIKEQE